MVLVTTPTGLLAAKKSLKALKLMVVDEADLLFSFGYEKEVRNICAAIPGKYQAIVLSATLNAEVEQLKGLMLHKPVVLELKEEDDVGGKLAHFYLQVTGKDKYLVLFALLKLELVQRKVLIFVSSTNRAYGVKLFLDKFAIPAVVLNAELPHDSRENILQAFNQGLVDVLIATDARDEEDEAEEADEDGEREAADDDKADVDETEDAENEDDEIEDGEDEDDAAEEGVEDDDEDDKEEEDDEDDE